jgi:hypothetical protein
MTEGPLEVINNLRQNVLISFGSIDDEDTDSVPQAAASKYCQRIDGTCSIFAYSK